MSWDNGFQTHRKAPLQLLSFKGTTFLGISLVDKGFYSPGVYSLHHGRKNFSSTTAEISQVWHL